MLFIVRNLAAATAAILLACACQTRYFTMPNSSMEPTIQAGERLKIDRTAYRSRLPERGELVAFHPANHPERLWILRVVALPGERLSVDQGHLVADGMPLACAWEPVSEDSSRHLASRGELPMRIPHGEYFVLGDNVREANDSRFWGTIRVSCIIGQVVPQDEDPSDRFSLPDDRVGRSR